MKLFANLTLEEIEEIKIEIGEAFVTNELFHEWGELSERYELVMEYMFNVCMILKTYMQQKMVMHI